MDRNTLDKVFVQACLYYVNNQVSGRRYVDTSEMASFGYADNDNVIINEWLVSDITEPSISTLMSYNEQNVIDFYYINYEVVDTLENNLIASLNGCKIPKTLTLLGPLRT